MELKNAKQKLNQAVVYNGSGYTFTECILWADNTGPRYSATLVDKNANSTIRVDLDKVKEVT
jgi:hypothetical protein